MYNKNKRVNTHTHTTSEQHMLVFGFTFNRSFTGTIPATINQHIDELLEKKSSFFKQPTTYQHISRNGDVVLTVILECLYCTSTNYHHHQPSHAFDITFIDYNCYILVFLCKHTHTMTINDKGHLAQSKHRGEGEINKQINTYCYKVIIIINCIPP